jgi:hypothetical protein
MLRRFSALPFLLALIGLWLLFFWRYLISGPNQVTYPAGDFTYQFFIFRDIAYRALTAGHLPLWSDCFFAGYPFHADPQSQLFYPPIWISFAILKLMGWGNFPLFALTLETALHYLLVSVGLFVFLRSELATQTQRTIPHSFGALLGSVTFTYGGYLTGYPPLQTGILETAAWLPLILLALRKVAATDQRRFTVIAALLLAVSFFAGHPQTFLFVIYLSIFYFIFQASLCSRSWRWSLSRLFSMLVLLLGLSLVQLLPQLQFLTLSTRASLTFEELSQGFPIGIVFQFLFTDPVWSPLYIGLPSLALAAVAIIVMRQRIVYFWFFTALVTLLLSMGSNTPFYTIAYWILPGFRLFRGQERLAFLVSFALAVLASYGCLWLLQFVEVKLKRFTTAAGSGLVAVTALNLFLVVTPTNAVVNFDPYPYNPILDPIRADPESFFRVQDDAQMQGHFACGYGFSEWGGISPIRLSTWQAFESNAPESLRWKLNGIKYLITWKNGAITREGELPPAERVAFGQAPNSDASGTKVYRLFEIPRKAWLVSQYQTVNDANAVFDLIRKTDFDPFQQAILRDAPSSSESTDEGSVAVVESWPGHLRLSVTAAAPTALIVSEAYYPGWAATLNGQTAAVYEADGFVQAVLVPSGDSSVELDYQPLPLRIGATVSFLALLICVIMALYPFLTTQPSDS